MLVPGRADVVIQTALALGFRIEEPYVLMAWRLFGNWCNYLPMTPGFICRPAAAAVSRLGEASPADDPRPAWPVVPEAKRQVLAGGRDGVGWRHHERPIPAYVCL
jgi:hypothetical protein